MEHNAITDSEETTVDNDSGLAKVRYGHNTPRKNITPDKLALHRFTGNNLQF